MGAMRPRDRGAVVARFVASCQLLSVCQWGTAGGYLVGAFYDPELEPELALPGCVLRRQVAVVLKGTSAGFWCFVRPSWDLNYCGLWCLWLLLWPL
jgi:hypothetical protein